MNKVTKISSAGLAAVGIAIVPAAQVHASPKKPIKIRTSCSQESAKAKPKQISFACADDGYGARDITWQHWGRKNAIGTATIYVNPCDPTCVEDGWDEYSAQIVATKVRKGKFTKVVVIYNGKHPEKQGTDVIDQS